MFFFEIYRFHFKYYLKQNSTRRMSPRGIYPHPLGYTWGTFLQLRVHASYGVFASVRQTHG